MTVLIVIHYISSDNKIMQRGSFPLRGKKPEEVAYEWLRKIKREMPYYEDVEKILADGEDITEKVRELETAPLD